MTFTFGVDPELFPRKDGKFVCAYGLIEGDKENPKRVEKGAVQVDGFALEFNIDPVKSEDDFVVAIHEVLQQLYALVPGYEVIATPVAHFDLEYIKAQPEKAKELGCDPDFNAWKNGECFPKPCGERPFRTGAGHLHIGWGEGLIDKPEHFQMCIDLVRQLDFFLGLPSLILDPDTQRKEMYGKAGCFRPKEYGVEYRTLSNFWITNENLIRYTYRNANLAIEELMKGNCLADELSIESVINTLNKKKALKIIKQFNIPLCNM